MKGIMLLMACILAGIGSVYAQPQRGSPWPMFHHDQYHTGRSPYNGPEIPTIKWSFATGSTMGSSPAIADDGTIYIASFNGNLYAVNPNGTEKWSYSLVEAMSSSPAIGGDGTIYVGDCAAGLFFAINPDGSEKWTYDMHAGTRPSPTIGQDGRIYVGSAGGDSKFYAFNPDGSVEWTYPIGGWWFYDAPSIGPDGTIYIRSDLGYLHAFTPSGSLRWQYYLGASGGSYNASTSFSVEDSTIYTSGMDGLLYAFSPDSTLKWTFPTGGWIKCAPAIGEDGTIYFGSLDSTFYALYPNGTLKWSFPTVGRITSSAAIDSNGTLYFGTFSYYTTGDRVYALNPDGSLLWSYGMPDEISSSPAIGSDGTLYIGCDDGKLYAFGIVDDVGPVSILSPGESVYVDSVYTPQAVVKNIGSNPESFDVECIIDTSGTPVYGDTSLVSDLAVGDSLPVSFKNWTVGPDTGVTYRVTVVTLLPGDYHPENDTLSKLTTSVPPVGIEEVSFLPPITTFQLFQNFPNPCGELTIISYQLPEPSHTTLEVHDLTGRLLRTLVDEKKKAGMYSISWDGRDPHGKKVATGIYFYRLSATGQGGSPPKADAPVEHASGGRTEPQTASRKMVLLR